MTLMQQAFSSHWGSLVQHYGLKEVEVGPLPTNHESNVKRLHRIVLQGQPSPLLPRKAPSVIFFLTVTEVLTYLAVSIENFGAQNLNNIFKGQINSTLGSFKISHLTSYSSCCKFYFLDVTSYLFALLYYYEKGTSKPKSQKLKSYKYC